MNLSSSKREEREQEARIALLQHFSSKSNNQVTSALTIALLFFAFIQSANLIRAIIGNWSMPTLFGSVSSKTICDLLFATLLSFFVALSVRTISRLLYWGELAGLVLDVELAPTSRMNQKWSKDLESRLKDRGYHPENRVISSMSLYIARLSRSCYDLYELKHPHPPLRFSIRYTRLREFLAFFALSLTVSIVFLVFGWSWGILSIVLALLYIWLQHP
jgi:hypothetical protein